MSAIGVLPTLPSFPAVDDLSERGELMAALSFIESASNWSAADLARWFATHAALIGRDSPPATLAALVTLGSPGRVPQTPAVTSGNPGRVPQTPAVTLGNPGRVPQTPPGEPPRSVRPEHMPRQIAMVRWQVILTVRGLLSRPADDRFLHAAIFAERVRRDQGTWRVAAKEGDSLADIVLALFTVDVLTHREFHEQKLCICDVCGRISYNPAVTTRAGCPDHVPAGEATSGVHERRPPRP